MNRTVSRTFFGAALSAALVATSVAAVAQAQRRGPGPQGGPPQGRAGRQAPGPGMPMLQPGRAMQPEMAAKIAQVMALRELHAARFSAKDISAALPVLREMHEAEQALQEKSLQALEREKQALLLAGPDDEPPAGSADAMREAAENHRAKMERLYAKLGEAIGEPKANAIRRLLGVAMGPMNMMPGGGPGFPGQPGMGMGPGMPQGPGMPPPGGPGPGPGPDPRGGHPESEFDVADAPAYPMFDGQGGPGDLEPSFQGPQGPQGPPAGGMVRPQRGNRQGPGGPALPGGPGAPGMFPGMGGMMGMPPMMGLGPRLTLPELIELLEQKQAAMRK